MDFWEVLNIAPTRDTAAIRAAYARLSKQHHPEDEPEKWQEINTAYRQAMSYAKFAPPEDEWFSGEAAKPRASAPARPPENVIEALRVSVRFFRYGNLKRRAGWRRLFRKVAGLNAGDDEYFLREFTPMLGRKIAEVSPKSQALIYDFFQLDRFAGPVDAEEYAGIYLILRNDKVNRPILRRQKQRDRVRSALYLLKCICLALVAASLLFFSIAVLVRVMPYLILAAAVAGIVYFLYRKRKADK